MKCTNIPLLDIAACGVNKGPSVQETYGKLSDGTNLHDLEALVICFACQDIKLLPEFDYEFIVTDANGQQEPDDEPIYGPFLMDVYNFEFKLLFGWQRTRRLEWVHIPISEKVLKDTGAKKFEYYKYEEGYYHMELNAEISIARNRIDTFKVNIGIHGHNPGMSVEYDLTHLLCDCFGEWKFEPPKMPF